MYQEPNSFVGSVPHRVMMFALSLFFLTVLVNVMIVAEPGYFFKAWFEDGDILTKMDSMIIRGSSALCALPLAILTPAFAISIFNDEFSRSLYEVLDAILPDKKDSDDWS